MKIAVTGFAGSGKSYLSEELSKKLNIPVLHLDHVKYTKEWKPIDDSEVLPKVEKFMENESWIIDGYYDYLLWERRFEEADKIILLLLPRLTCLISALSRTKGRRKRGYKNDMNLWFFRFILVGCRSRERMDKYAELENKYKDKTVVLRTRREVKEYLKTTE